MRFPIWPLCNMVAALGRKSFRSICIVPLFSMAMVKSVGSQSCADTPSDSTHHSKCVSGMCFTDFEDCKKETKSRCEAMLKLQRLPDRTSSISYYPSSISYGRLVFSSLSLSLSPSQRWFCTTCSLRSILQRTQWRPLKKSQFLILIRVQCT
jgi:hypothetical protein